MEERHKKAELSNGLVVNERWKIENLICKGTFGTVSYEVSDLKRPKERFVLKAEAAGEVSQKDGIPKFLHMEIKLLMALKQKQSEYFRGLKSGGETDKVVYFVTHLYGRTLHDIRLKLPQKHFTLGTNLHIAHQSLLGLEEIHSVGYVLRDVKPENMVTGRLVKDIQRIYLINYELCRKYIDERKNHRPLRVRTEFRGSPRYASVDALMGKEQVRADDLWSWLQSLIEMTVGKLPFIDENGPSTLEEFLPWLADRKKKVFNDSAVMLAGCPNEYRKIYDHLCSLKPLDKPNYSALFDAIADSMKINKVDSTIPVDWNQQQGIVVFKRLDLKICEQ